MREIIPCRKMKNLLKLFGYKPFIEKAIESYNASMKGIDDNLSNMKDELDTIQKSSVLMECKTALGEICKSYRGNFEKLSGERESLKSSFRELMKGRFEKGFKYNSYMGESLGRNRADMPQINESDLDSLLIHFSGNSKDAGVTKSTMKLSKLKPSQDDINVDKVIDGLTNDNWKERNYVVSKDNYIVDGHHSWASGLEINPDEEVTVYKVNLPIKELIRRTKLLKICRPKVEETTDIIKSVIDGFTSRNELADYMGKFDIAVGDDVMEKLRNGLPVPQSEIIKGNISDVVHCSGKLERVEIIVEGDGRVDVLGVNVIQKAEYGIYSDNYINKKLGRVGQKYAKDKRDDSGEQSKKKEDDDHNTRKHKEQLASFAREASDRELKDSLSSGELGDTEREVAEKELKSRGLVDEKKNDGETKKQQPYSYAKKTLGRSGKFIKKIATSPASIYKGVTNFLESSNQKYTYNFAQKTSSRYIETRDDKTGNTFDIRIANHSPAITDESSWVGVTVNGWGDGTMNVSIDTSYGFKTEDVKNIMNIANEYTSRDLNKIKISPSDIYDKPNSIASDIAKENGMDDEYGVGEGYIDSLIKDVKRSSEYSDYKNKMMENEKKPDAKKVDLPNGIGVNLQYIPIESEIIFPDKFSGSAMSKIRKDTKRFLLYDIGNKLYDGIITESDYIDLATQFIDDILKKNNIEKSIEDEIKKPGETVYADCIIRDKNDKLLLLKRTSSDEFRAGEWCLPGGHVEDGETPVDAMKREVKEETNIDVDDYNRFVDSNQNPNGSTSNYFSYTYDGDGVIILNSNEHDSYQWMTEDEWSDVKMVGQLKERLKEMIGHKSNTVEKSMVLHPKYNVGSVLSSNDDTVTASFESFGTKTVLKSSISRFF